ncbi:MAG: hypothetical protein ACI3XI_09580 [Eubacteriales bacterium]
MKHLSRVIIAILIATMLVPLTLSCADTGSTETTVAETTVATDATSLPEETLYAPSEIPDDMKFPGTTIKFLYWKDVEHAEFFVEDQNGEAVNDAIYNRNNRVEQQFEVNLEFTGTLGNYQNQANFVNTCINSTQSGADAHDVFCGYSMTGATLMIKGIAQDLTDYEIFEFDKPWWPETLISKATIRDSIYFASGDISTNYLYMMYGCFFNKNMFTDLHSTPDTLYNLVYDKAWTLDKLIEYSTGVFSEMNSDNVASIGDRFGFVTIDIHFDSFYTGSDLYTVVVDKDDNLALSNDLFSDKTVALLEKVNTFIHDSGDCWSTNSATIFSSGQALFTIDRVRHASKELKDADFDFGILPIPKYDADQENYRTCMAFPFTIYVLSTASNNPEAAAATLELMAYQSYLLITPALFEEAMKIRYADEGNDSLMYDIIRENVVIDLGRLLSTQVSNLSYQIFRDAVKYDRAGSWSSMKSKQSNVFKNKLKDVNEALDNLK